MTLQAALQKEVKSVTYSVSDLRAQLKAVTELELQREQAARKDIEALWYTLHAQHATQLAQQVS